MTIEEYKEYVKEWNSRTTKVIFELLRFKYQNLPLISTISVAILALLSINKDLIANLFLFKISLIIFACLVPVSLWLSLLTSNFELNQLLKSKPLSYPIKREEIEKILKELENKSTVKKIAKAMFDDLKKGERQKAKEKFWQLFYTTSPYLLTIIISIAVLLLVISLSK